jgi:gluconate 5-dehydrogenase
MTDVKALFDLTGKVALVTGGSRGLGLEMAIGLGAAGAAVAVTARREEWLTTARHTLDALGIDNFVTTCDVSQEDQVLSTVAAVSQRFGSIDALVNSAGVSWGEPALTMPIAKWRAVLDTNVTGSFLMARAVAAQMIRTGRAGAIVNVASIAGLVGTPAAVLDAVSYSASKGAIISLTRDLAVKWAPHGIRVNAIAPGFFDTRMTKGVLDRSRADIERATPLGRIGRPEELKGAAVFLASAASAYMTGQVVVIDGGMTAI